MKSLCVFLLGAAAVIEGMPTGLQVGTGEATFNFSSPDVLEILVSDRSILNWEQFSIAGDETVSFLQTAPSSCVLNRVLGNDPSHIFGALSSNGKVVLINPRGILFGAEARVDVGSLIASTLDLQERDFLEWHFSGSGEGAIQNAGSIRTSDGDLILLASQVNNSGYLEAASGTIAIGAGLDILVSPQGTRQIFIKPMSAGALIEQSGMIRAAHVEMEVDGNPYSLAFRHCGSIDALGDEVLDGAIYLRVPSGEAFVSGSMNADSGHIALTGEKIALLENGRLDVSGDTGGGSVVIGGDYHLNPHAKLSEMIYVDPEASIFADARVQGSGGRVTIWSEEATRVYGHVSARGGALFGDGGLVEVSGQNHLDFQGTVSTLAPHGKGGTLLLDPLDITIVAAVNAFVNGATPFMPTGGACSPGPGNATLSAVTLTAALVAGNVIVQTTGTAGACPGDITVSAPVAWSPAAGTVLTLQSARNITINRAIQESSVSSTGGVVLIAPGTITITPVGGIAAVGSLRGITMVGDPALLRCNRSRPNLTLQGGAFVAQLGFNNPLVAASGSIDVTCGVLRAIAGAGAGASAQIGHGANFGATVLTTTAAATIAVDATGDITLQSIGGNSVGQIGHGNASLSAGSSLLGDICVTTSANVFITATPPTANPRAQIGHGSTLGTVLTANGKIGVTAGQNITLTMALNCAISIGHYTQLVGVATSMIGDVNIFCGNDFIINQVGIPSAVYIGHAILFMPNIPTITSNITLSTVRDVNIIQNGAGNTPCCIAGNATILTGSLQIAVGRDLTFSSLAGGLNIPFNIGYSGPALSPGLAPNNTYIAVRRNLLMGSVNGYRYNIRAPNDLNIGVGGNVDFNATGGLTRNISSLNAVSGTTRIWAGGRINAQNAIVQIGTTGRSLDLRAGTDMQLFNGLAATTGTIVLGVGTQFAASDLWAGGATQLASVAQQALPAFTPSTCPGCTVVPFSLTTSSAAVAPQCGTFNPALVAQSFTTTTGSITLLSACNNCATNPLNIGPGGNLQIATTSGSIAATSFFNIAVNQALTTTTGSITLGACNNLDVNQPIQTSTGPISLTADSDLSGAGNLNILNNITSTAGGSISLTAGFGAPFGASAISQTAGTVASNGGAITARAVGDITLCGALTSINSAGGPIRIESETGSISIDQDVTSLGGTIDVIATTLDVTLGTTCGAGGLLTSTTGNITVRAGRDFITNGDPTSILSTSGNVSAFIGNDTSVTTDILTNGAILMITGHSTSLFGTAQIHSTGSSVTLVVDSNFPAAPLIGLGFINTDPGTSIQSGGPLLIYTAQQSFNSILGLLNGLSFVPGLLYTDTTTEHWCTYYPNTPLGSPYTVYYKDCLQQATNQAIIIIQQLLATIDPFVNPNWPYFGTNEYYGWPTKFFILYHLAPVMPDYKDWPAEGYILRKHNDLLLAPRRESERI